MTLLSKIRVGLLSTLILSTTFTALPAQAEPTPPAPTPSIRAGDLIAFDTDGKLWDYRPSGETTWSRHQIGSGWNVMRDLKTVDWNQDYIEDIIAVGKNGDLHLYLGKREGGFIRTTIGTGWGSYDISVGQWKVSDEYPSIIAVNLDTEILYNYPNLSGGALSPRVIEGRGWSRSLQHQLLDYDFDGKADILAQQSATGKLLRYRTDGNGNFINEPRPVVGTGWSVMNEVAAYSGYQGDGLICNCPTQITHPGLLARTHDGILYYYGLWDGKWSTPDRIGTGWNGYTFAGSESPRRFSY
ncbi:hypothetical protein ASH00_03200 [Arthrobacter sp. Soil782]|uniref:hypothetical protein n=1 Tax=Arthrobacter sp. Soil782 TaxID=1736410 RepID=UPI0006FDF192|nr:hypothetical protein [Arthrobacter sp. Soil782]KRF08720.1 hypothetical protein ASH00_03200 [Arthrobacter sp. Soil782]